MNLMTDTPKRGRGRPTGPGKRFSDEHRAKLSEAARRQHADLAKQAHWRESMEPVWESMRGPRHLVNAQAEAALKPSQGEPGETPTVDENELEEGTQ